HRHVSLAVAHRLQTEIDESRGSVRSRMCRLESLKIPLSCKKKGFLEALPQGLGVCPPRSIPEGLSNHVLWSSADEGERGPICLEKRSFGVEESDQLKAFLKDGSEFALGELKLQAAFLDALPENIPVSEQHLSSFFLIGDIAN